MERTILQSKEITIFIRREVIKALREIMTDPDFGLELTDYAKKRLKQSMASKKTTPLDKILKKYGV